MSLLILTKEKLTYDHAPPSRILHIKHALERHLPVSVIGRHGGHQERNVRTLSWPTGFFANQTYKLILTVLACWMMLRGKVSAVMAREYYYPLLLWPIAKITHTALYYDMHCFRWRELLTERRFVKSAVVRLFETMCHRAVDHISVISPHLEEDLQASLRRKAFLLPNGVDVPFIRKRRASSRIRTRYQLPRGRIVGFIGHWMPWVDIDTILESSKHLPKGTTLLVVGNCARTGNLGDLQRRYPEVIFTGDVGHEEAISLLHVMDVCVLAYKSFDVIKHLSVRKTFEYLAAGKPIVMSRSAIMEREMLEEGVHYISFPVGDAKALARAAVKAGRSRGMGRANAALAERFDWRAVIASSSLLPRLGLYTEVVRRGRPAGAVAIIIKALNEEEHIVDCVRSAKRALSDLEGGVLLVDSRSEDKTVELAGSKDIEVVRLKRREDRSCGVGPQIGYLRTKAPFVYILDGDMEIDRGFLNCALPYFNDVEIAGVGGCIEEKSRSNLAFQVRAAEHIVSDVTAVERLGMGGLYRRSALDDAGGMSNPSLYAYEEYDLGQRLRLKGWKLLRIPVPMVLHYGDTGSALTTIMARWKSRYLLGSGQYLRRALRQGHFLRTAWELRIYLVTLLWIVLGLASLFALPSLLLLEVYLGITALGLLALAIKKRSITRTLFSMVSWTSQAMGMVVGFLKGASDIGTRRIDVEVVR